VTLLGALANPGLPEVPEHSPSLAMKPGHWWCVEANTQQLDSITELQGTEVTVGELLQRLDLASFEKLPPVLNSQLYEDRVQWLGESLRHLR